MKMGTSGKKTKFYLKFYGIIPALVSLIIFGIVALAVNISIGFITLGAVVILYSFFIFYAYVRTKHFMTLISTLYMINLGLVYMSFYDIDIFSPKWVLSNETKLLLFTVIVLMIWVFISMMLKKYKWRGRDILELAAQEVEDNPGSFTSRPQPTGKVDFTKSELTAYAKFIQRSLLGLAYKESDKIIFMPLKYRNEYLALYNPNYDYFNKTWLAIDFEGHVSVNISQDDYLDYKEDLDFDHLCKSFSDLMISFIEMFLKGEKVRIKDKLDRLNISIFS
jgi:hypothetical protein